MNGPHDLGGADGFGAVDTSKPNEAWGLRVHALAIACVVGGVYRTPAFRHALERIPPARYLSSSYYERWTTAVASLLVEHGVLSADDVGFELSAPVRAPRITDPGPDVSEPRFAIGDEVRVLNTHPLGHTRCPRYVRGRRGTIVRYDGACNLDDVEAHSDARRRVPLYCVRFDARELWGEGAEPSTVHVDLFESHLEER